MHGKRLIAAAAGTAAGLFGWVQAAQAGAAGTVIDTLIGTVTASQYKGYCDDLGAHVRVRVAGGKAATRYTVWGSGFMQSAKSFTTDSKGAGRIDLHNIGVAGGGSVGSAVILVSTSFYTVTVPAKINCPARQGD